MSYLARLVVDAARKSRTADHVASYMWSGGREGHVVDLSDIGGHRFTTTLLLAYVSKGSGAPVIVPLIYGNVEGEIAIVASGREPGEPAPWYEGMRRTETVDLQVATQAFRATWRIAEGEDRATAWAHMEAVFPPFKQNRSLPGEQAPLVLLSPVEAIASFNR
jgi:deazaflavin-dependent oxidoreductase (nitroreductase family)